MTRGDEVREETIELARKDGVWVPASVDPEAMAEMERVFDGAAAAYERLAAEVERGAYADVAAFRTAYGKMQAEIPVAPARPVGLT